MQLNRWETVFWSLVWARCIYWHIWAKQGLYLRQTIIIIITSFREWKYLEKQFNDPECRWRPVWPDWAIYWTLGNFSKPVATISLPKSPTFLGNSCKGFKILNFSSDIIFGQLLQTFGNFLLVTLASSSFLTRCFIARLNHRRKNGKKWFSVKISFFSAEWLFYPTSKCSNLWNRGLLKCRDFRTREYSLIL